VIHWIGARYNKRAIALQMTARIEQSTKKKEGLKSEIIGMAKYVDAQEEPRRHSTKADSVAS
jgi:hypothetical protein